MKKIIVFFLLCVVLCGCKAENKIDTPADVITWEEKQISIEGIEADYNIWFLADSHIIVQDGSESAEVAAYAAERAAGFENDLGVSSDKIFTEFIDEANKKMPDIVIFGGDIIDFPSEANVAFLQSQLARLKVPYMFAMGNHDWTFPWEYMTETGATTYRPMLEKSMFGNFTSDALANHTLVSAMGNSYVFIAEFEDLVLLAVDDSSNQVAAECLEGIEKAYSYNKPIILVQHVPFSTEKLIAKAKEEWGNPVTLGMQVHGGIAPNEVSANLWEKTHSEDALIKLVLAGHVHFGYEEQLSDVTTQIITDAAFKGKAVKLTISGDNIEHQYFCDKFMLTVDDKQYDLKEIMPQMSSVSELFPITNEQLYILGRIDENSNALIVYDFSQDAFVFAKQGSTMCWVQDEFETVRYLKDNVVYDLYDNVIYEAEEDTLIRMIEYVEKDFKVTITDKNHENPQELWIE